MKDEIKEITLKDLLPYEFYINKNKQMVAEITIEKLNIILDILTNLQEELEEEKRIEKASLDTINNLQEENKKLNNIINELEGKIYYLYNYAGLDTSNLENELKELKEIKGGE